MIKGRCIHVWTIGPTRLTFLFVLCKGASGGGIICRYRPFRESDPGSQRPVSRGRWIHAGSSNTVLCLLLYVVDAVDLRPATCKYCSLGLRLVFTYITI